jgi:hypothetical protein
LNLRFSLLQDRVNESRVGVDARMISNEAAQQLYPLLLAKKSKLVYPSQNLIDLVWVNKPGRSRNKIFVQPIEYTGQFHASVPSFCDSLVGNVLIQAKMPRKSSPKFATGSEISPHPVHRHPRTRRRRLSNTSAPW